MNFFRLFPGSKLIESLVCNSFHLPFIYLRPAKNGRSRETLSITDQSGQGLSFATALSHYLHLPHIVILSPRDSRGYCITFFKCLSVTVGHANALCIGAAIITPQIPDLFNG